MKLPECGEAETARSSEFVENIYLKKIDWKVAKEEYTNMDIHTHTHRGVNTCTHAHTYIGITTLGKLDL